MNTRPARILNLETAERRAARLLRDEILAEQRAFLENFDQQVAELAARGAVRGEEDKGQCADASPMK